MENAVVATWRVRDRVRPMTIAIEANDIATLTTITAPTVVRTRIDPGGLSPAAIRHQVRYPPSAANRYPDPRTVSSAFRPKGRSSLFLRCRT